MPVFWGVTTADLIDLDLKELHRPVTTVDQLSSRGARHSSPSSLAKKLAKVGDSADCAQIPNPRAGGGDR